ncbi:MAG TPA: hypothetical protein VLJ61_04155 [Pyrinomonadaceae bacterium]|nr:hypothetical protein [Pyrinomonadaceae bacterium]
MAATKSKTSRASKKTAANARPKTAAKKPKAAKPKAAAKKVLKAAAVKAKPAAAKKKDAAKTKKTAAFKSRSKATTKGAAKASKKKEPKEAPQKRTAKDALDFAEFPAGTFTRHDVTLCLACIFRLFTNQLGLAPRTAYNEIRRYAPSVEELTSRNPQRPFFKPSEEKNPHCPYCEAPKRWHARVAVHRVEGGKASDAARRALLKKLPAKDEQFQIHEERKTARQVFFEWLERMGQELDFEDDSAWMPLAARSYLERREPKTDWSEVFRGLRAVRRSHRLEDGWERDGARLFLAPATYNDVLLVQYLVSRSHRHGGRTFEGRLTLPELVRRMRYGGHLEARGITDRDQFDVLEQLVERLTGGDEPAKLHFIIDRRELLERVKDVYDRHA